MDKPARLRAPHYVEQQREVVITQIHHGEGGRSDVIYCQLVDAHTGDCIISATIDYVLRAVNSRNLRLVKAMKQHA